MWVSFRCFIKLIGCSVTWHLQWLQRCRDIIQDGRLALVVSRRGRSSRSLYRHVYDTLQDAVDDSRCGPQSRRTGVFPLNCGVRPVQCVGLWLCHLRATVFNTAADRVRPSCWSRRPVTRLTWSATC
jgi:hypothetical protein